MEFLPPACPRDLASLYPTSAPPPEVPPARDQALPPRPFRVMSQLPARSTCTIIIFFPSLSLYHFPVLLDSHCTKKMSSFTVFLYCFVLFCYVAFAPNIHSPEFPALFFPLPFFFEHLPVTPSAFSSRLSSRTFVAPFFLLRPATNFPNRHHLPTSPPAPDPEFPHANTLSNGTSASSGASPNYPLFPPPHHGPANSFCRQRTHAASTVTFWRQSSLLAILSPQFCAMLPFPCFASLLRLA